MVEVKGTIAETLSPRSDRSGKEIDNPLRWDATLKEGVLVYSERIRKKVK